MKLYLFLILLLVSPLSQLSAQHVQNSRIELVRFDMDTLHFLQDTVKFFPDSMSNAYSATIYISLDTFAANINTFFSWKLRVRNTSAGTLQFLRIANSGGPIIGETVQPRIVYPYKEMDLTGLMDNNKFSGGSFQQTISYYFGANNRQYIIYVKLKGYKKLLYR